MTQPSEDSSRNQPAVPIIDIAGYFTGSHAEKAAIAARIDAACRSIGFLVITGHGVAAELTERMHRVSRAFYDLPEEVKLRYRAPDPKIYRGYFAVGGLAAAYSLDDRKAAPDYREMYTICRVETDPADPYYTGETGRSIFVPNIWPGVVENFESTWREYYQRMETLAQALMHLFALALGLPETWFDGRIDKHMATMSAVNYPDQPVAPLPGQLRCGAHTDYGALTILASENKPGGLEVLTAEGRWDPVPMIPGTLVINVGDLLARWTNDRWVSSLHRVSNPPREHAIGSRRQSLAFFFHPNYDAVIECLASCAGASGAKYPPTTTAAHLLAKIAKMRDVPTAQ
jgi:isopenicillin N synthase-like dioxygenase